MTTRHSPLRVLKAQADLISAMIKAAERGEKIEAKFAERIEAARAKDSLKVGIVMDDKVISIEMPWATIRSTSTSGISEYIMDRMREIRHGVVN